MQRGTPSFAETVPRSNIISMDGPAWIRLLWQDSKENEIAMFLLAWTCVESASRRCATRATAFLGGVTGFHGGILGLGAKEKVARP